MTHRHLNQAINFRTLRPLAALSLAGLAGMFLLLLTCSAAAQSASQRTLYVSAVDKKGVVIDGLAASAFSVKENGKQREVVSAEKTADPLDVLILFDNSASSGDRIKQMRDAVANFATTLVGSPGTQVGVMTIGERSRVVSDFTGDAQRLTGVIGQLFPMPQTSMVLLDSVIDASAASVQRRAPRLAIVAVFTDGAETSNEISKNVVSALRGARATMYLVGVGTFTSAARLVGTSAASSQQATVERMTLIEDGPKTTGGQWEQVGSVNNLDAELQTLAKQLLGQYKVVYTSPDPAGTPEKPAKIEVKSNQKDVKMRGSLSRQ